MNHRLRPLIVACSSLLLAASATAASAPVPGAQPDRAGVPTFTKDIAPIVFQNCAQCHRTGEVAPFPLTSYSDVARRAKTISEVVAKRLMPPWKAEPGLRAYHDEQRLTDAQIRQLQHWAEAGAPEGNPADLPALPKFSEGWSLGEPDLILEMPEAFHVAAEGRDIYRNFVLPSGFTEDRWVVAVEVRPDNRRVVHHLLVHLDTSGRARELDAKDAGPGYATRGGVGFPSAGQIGGWAPGNLARRLPEGVAMRVPKGADIVIQVHYNRSGKPETDRSKIGLYFAGGPVEKRSRLFPLVSRINIPAGEANYTTKATIPVPAEITLHSVMPHMHLLGREIKVTATLPDGRKLPLVSVPEWDFNWQMTYAFKEPVSLPRGSQVTVEARYDNSAANPRNPHSPPQLVKWGEQTSDEMCLAYLHFTMDKESLTQGRGIAGIEDLLQLLAPQRKKATSP